MLTLLQSVICIAGSQVIYMKICETAHDFYFIILDGP